LLYPTNHWKQNPTNHWKQKKNFSFMSCEGQIMDNMVVERITRIEPVCGFICGSRCATCRVRGGTRRPIGTYWWRL
jgi:hypothetical protein